MIRHITCFLTLAFLLSCGNKSELPPGILKSDKMQAVLWDIIRADTFTTEYIKRDSAKNDVEENLKLQQQIFAMHHVSKEDFYKSFEYYKRNSGLMKTIIDSMVSQADKKRTSKTGPVQAQ
ncbi:MAG TPA: DUF4296 domain-containing protein [Ferruginibacter sp.]|nr:DUF4296 domain-containing protein [Ferruginibacter sp.]